MSITLNLLNVPPVGLEFHHEVEPATLALSPDDGIMIGNFHCTGNLSLVDERSAQFCGVIAGKVFRECVRCLAQFEESLSLPFGAQFHKPSNVAFTSSVKGKGSKAQEILFGENMPDEDVYPISGNDIDLLPAIREHVILAAPLQPLCKEDCLGLCQTCGINLNESKCECYTPVTASSPADSVKQTWAKKNPSTRSSVTIRRGS